MKTYYATNEFDNILKAGRKVQIGVTLALWGIWGILAYKFWGKSNFWKGAIIVTGIGNASNTYKTFAKPSITATDKPPSTASKSNLNDEIYVEMQKFANSKLNLDKKPMPDKAAFYAKINTLSETDKKIVLEIAKGMTRVMLQYQNRQMDESTLGQIMVDLENTMKPIATKYGKENVTRLNEFMQGTFSADGYNKKYYAPKKYYESWG